MKISVCIDMMYPNVDPVEAMRAVKAQGIDVIEFWGWQNKDLDAVRRACEELSMEVAVFCVSGAQLLVDPDRHADYRQDLKESLAAAKRVGCKTLITGVGNARPGVSREVQHAAIVEGLRSCGPLLEESGVTLAIEPLNILVEHIGYYLPTSTEALEILEEVNHPRVRMLFDIYHQQISEGHLIANITRMTDFIMHFHCAGNPGRHELDNGEINYEAVFRAIRKTGYAGFVGLEYVPLEPVEKGIARASAQFDRAKE